MGKPHGQSLVLGSVFDRELVSDNGSTLWLEHVESIPDGAKTYWLMWYDPTGMPTIPLSGALDKEQIQEMARQLASFLP